LASSQESNNHTVADLQALRRSGRLSEALQAATQALRLSPADAGISLEAVRLLVLGGQTETAVQLYSNLTDNQLQENNLEPEALVRLALQMGRLELLDGLPRPAGPSWLVHLLDTGEDPLLKWEIQKMEVTVANGPSAYIFTTACPHCRHCSQVAVSVNLLVQQDGLCPACFGQGRLHYREICDFIRRRHPDLLEIDNLHSGDLFHDNLREKLMTPGQAPDVVQNLGQEYQFLLYEIVTRYRLSRGSAG
jgi:tetratricopeptide (TPR) repeat protein